ncbi:unnamed protein product [Ilex paraguariensis]|uniref:Uncharacterized protein n=1 Tax=Ilex paraguariensis TaxID=185542 RepID=A0ABC8TQD7_9AQUA
MLLTKNASGNTALHEAAMSGQKGVAESMVTKNPTLVFERTNLNETPLYLTAAFGKIEVFTLLESYNSDCRIRRHDGSTILHAAIKEERYSGTFMRLEATMIVVVGDVINNTGLGSDDAKKGQKCNAKESNLGSRHASSDNNVGNIFGEEGNIREIWAMP